jgi:nucleoside-diphosphate-sugar epimerase
VLRSLREDIPFRPPSVPSHRDFVDVTDVVRAIMLAMEDASSNGVVNVGTGIETSVEELISLAEDVTGLRLRYASEPYPGRPADRAHSSADTSKARTQLGWEPTVTLAAGLAELWTTS